MQFNWINWINLAAVICLIFINIFAVRKDVAGSFHSRYRIVNIFEQVGRYGCMLFMFLPIWVRGWEFGFASVAEMLIWICLTVLLLVVYTILWISKSRNDNKKILYGLAIVPAILFLVNGILLRHIALIVCALIFCVFHLFITKENA